MSAIVCKVHKVLREAEVGDGSCIQYRVVSWNRGAPRFEVAHLYRNKAGEERVRLQKFLDWTNVVWLRDEGGLEKVADALADALAG